MTQARTGWRGPLAFFLIIGTCHPALTQAVPRTGTPGPFYSVRTEVKHPSDPSQPLQCRFMFMRGDKVLWALRSGEPATEWVIIQKTGRCFVQSSSSSASWIRVFERTGHRLMILKGRLLAVAPMGDHMAYDPSAEKGPSDHFQVLGFDGHPKKAFKPVPGFSVKALARDAKTVLTQRDGDPSDQEEYQLQDAAGQVLWAKKTKGFLSDGKTVEGMPSSSWKRNGGRTFVTPPQEKPRSLSLFGNFKA